MLKLHQLPTALGLANISPPCMKLETWLRMTGIPYEVAPVDLAQMPKGKAPYITTKDGQRIGDSTLIIEYLKQAYGKDPDAHLGLAERAVALAFRRMLKENTYWIIMQARYKTPSNWEMYRQGIVTLLPAEMPEPQREQIAEGVRKNICDQMYGHGIGRHSDEDVFALGIRDVTAVSDYLAEKPFFMGNEPTTADATVYAYIANIVEAPFASPVQDFCFSRPNLVEYCRRMGARYFPELRKSTT